MYEVATKCPLHYMDEGIDLSWLGLSYKFDLHLHCNLAKRIERLTWMFQRLSQLEEILEYN